MRSISNCLFALLVLASIAPTAPVRAEQIEIGLVPKDPPFPVLRAAADQVARHWNVDAKLFRVDLAASYSRSVTSFGISRLIYFQPGNHQVGLEVGYDPGVDPIHLRSASYPLAQESVPVEVPVQFLDPSTAIRRLWELEPSVPTNRVFVQLLKVGVEPPVAGASERTSYPEPFLLEHLPVAVIDSEAKTPKDRFVWRMVAIRDFDAPMAKPYGVFIYIDAQSGRSLSPRGPGITGADLIYLKVPQASPIPIFDFDSLPANSALTTDGAIFAPESFDLLAIRQEAESLALGLRQMVALGDTDAAFDAAADKVARWSARIPSLQAQADREGIARLEAAVEKDPHNADLRARLARRYVDQVEKERVAAHRVCPPVLRFDASPTVVGFGPVTALDPHTWQWLYSFTDAMLANYPQLSQLRPIPSKYGKLADQAIADTLAIDPNQPLAWAERARLQRMETLDMDSQYAACEKAISLNPRAAYARLLFAAYPASWDDSKRMSAVVYRQSRFLNTMSQTSHDTSSGRVTITRYYRHEIPPSVEQLARADRLEGEAQKMRVWTARLKDEAMKLDPRDPKIYFIIGRALSEERDLRDRVACDGLLADPSYSKLYELRPWIYDFLPKGQPVNEAVTMAALTFDEPYDVSKCLTLGSRTAARDGFTAYCATLQAIRLDPANPQAHLSLAGGLWAMHGYTLNGVELMPDAMEQAQLEYSVAGKLAAHALAGGERCGLSDAALNQIITQSHDYRAQCLRATGRRG